MSGLNPLSGAILQSITSQREMGIEKERQVRREQVLEKNVAAQDDRFEHQVESSDQVSDVNDEEKQRQEQQRRERQAKTKENEKDQPRLDVTG